MKKDKPADKKIKNENIPGIKPPRTRNVKTSGDELFPIVGIGASAGGLEALESFFKNVPEKSGIAFVVIQHLDPTQKGIMPELLQRITSMEVVSATDRLKVKPDCIYVIPSNKSMSIMHRSLYLFEPLEIRGLRLPIDFFFRSLAEDLQDHSIGIILSGMGSDGSAGVRAIKEKSGLVMVQDPGLSKFNGMPVSAINAVPVDFIAPAEQLPQKLLTYLAAAKVVQPDAGHKLKDKSALEKIIILLRIQMGHDFSQYKSNTLYRRIERRMGIHLISKIGDYVRYLQENHIEIEILFKELLIGVTHFSVILLYGKTLKKKYYPKCLKDCRMVIISVPGFPDVQQERKRILLR